MVVIRLRRTGARNRKQWRIVVMDQRTARDGRLVEAIGFYNPLAHPPLIQIQLDRYSAWVEKGARPSEAVQTLVQSLKETQRAP